MSLDRSLHPLLSRSSGGRGRSARTSFAWGPPRYRHFVMVSTKIMAGIRVQGRFDKRDISKVSRVGGSRGKSQKSGTAQRPADLIASGGVRGRWKIAERCVSSASTMKTANWAGATGRRRRGGVEIKFIAAKAAECRCAVDPSSPVSWRVARRPILWGDAHRRWQE